MEDLRSTVERLTAQIQEYEKEIAQIREKEEPVKIRGYLPRLTPYQKAVIRLHGTRALGRSVPYGQSWHGVKGQRSSSLTYKNRRAHRRWLKKVDQSCLENPSDTFKVSLNKQCLTSAECRTKKQPNGKVVEDVVVELQLLGVEVTL